MPKQLKKVRKKKQLEQQLKQHLKKIKKIKKKPISPLYKYRVRLYRRFLFKLITGTNFAFLPAQDPVVTYNRKKIKFLIKVRFKFKKRFFFRVHHAKLQNINFRIYSKRVRKKSRSTVFPYAFSVNHKKRIRKLFRFNAPKKKIDFIPSDYVRPKHPVGPFVRWARRLLTRGKPRQKKPVRKKLKYVSTFYRLRVGSKYGSRRIRYWLRRNFDKKIKPYLRKLVNVLVQIRVYKKATKLYKPNWRFLPPRIRFLFRRLVLRTFKYNRNWYAPRPRLIRYKFPRSLSSIRRRQYHQIRRSVEIKRVAELVFSNYSPRRNFAFNFRKGNFLKAKQLGLRLYRKSRFLPIISRVSSLPINSTRRVPKKLFSLAYPGNSEFGRSINYLRKSKTSNVGLRFFKRRLIYYKRKAHFAIASEHIANKIRFFWLIRAGLRPKYARKLSHFIRTRYASYQPFLGAFRKYAKTYYFYKRKRRKFFRYFNNLLAKRTFHYGLSKYTPDTSKSRDSFFIHIFRSINNIFINFTTQKGRSIYVYSSGRGFFKGSKRLSPVAVEAMGRHFSSLIKISKVKNVGIVFHTRLDFLVRALLKGLRFHLYFTSFKYHLTRPHNGLRKPASRRI